MNGVDVRSGRVGAAASARMRGFGAGKVILLGEHAVVYGHPAVAGPLPRGVRAEGRAAPIASLRLPDTVPTATRRALTAAFERAARAAGAPGVEVRLRSELPISLGLGSSAALAVACARVLLIAAGRAPGARQVIRLALEMEREFHGSPSGIDHTCSALGQLIRYRLPARAEVGRARVLRSPRALEVLVMSAGIRPPTRTTVAALRERRGRSAARCDRLLAEIGRLADEGAAAIEAGDLQGLGDAMNANHGLLSALQLSSGSIEAAVHTLREAGALGAKLTGAGGDGGAVIGLFADAGPALRRLRRRGIACFASRLAGPEEP